MAVLMVLLLLPCVFFDRGLGSVYLALASWLWVAAAVPLAVMMIRELLRHVVRRLFQSYGRLAEFVQKNLFGEERWRQVMSIEVLIALMGDHDAGKVPLRHGPRTLLAWRAWWDRVDGRLEFDTASGVWLIHPAAACATANAAARRPDRAGT